MPESSAKPKVVILGGGIGALSTAFELTDQPDWRDRFESITVYQMGWRLGGKGASGRNPQSGQRIEEHGLHVWPGFYENAFQVMRRCYDELDRPATSPLARWDDAFKPHHFIVVTEQVGGDWKHWAFEAPPNGSVPGESNATPELREYILGGLELMVNWFHQATGMPTPELGPVTPPQAGLFSKLLSVVECGLRWVGLGGWSKKLRSLRLSRLLRTVIDGVGKLSEQSMLDVALELARQANTKTAMRRQLDQELVVWLSDGAICWFESQHDDVATLGDSLRRLWIQLDMARAMLRGIVVDRVIDRGFDALDAEDFLSWLRRHGASSMTLHSALTRGLHDFVFAYENADPARPNLAAGVALRLILRLTFTYKGAIMWKMQAGMGDIVFAPLYQVLRERGVQFQFFHCVKQLHLAEDGKSIGRITMGRQASVTEGEYQPLIDVQGLPCWPNHPCYDQLVEGSDLQARNIDLESVWTDWTDVEEVQLTRGQDFDVAILGLSLAALRDTCGALVQADPAWRGMLQHVKTVKTLAAQLWFTKQLADLGWPLQSPILTAYQKSLETWADMSQTLVHEAWPQNGAPKSVAYFCGTMPDDGPFPEPVPNPFPQQQKRKVHDAAITWLKSRIRPLFPAASVPGTGELDWTELHDKSGASGVARFETQYWKANVQPSDRYVQSWAGTTQYRLRPGQSGFGNLYLAGDWTRSGLNVGCVEAAVMSGRRAGRDILGNKQPVVGERDE